MLTGNPSLQVGYDTCNSSDDPVLKQEMPPALQRVEVSSRTLEDACQMLQPDPYSGPARKKLIDGSRGILAGTSALLLCFDESEVRKIIRVCRKVLDYLAVAEVIESYNDLTPFVRVSADPGGLFRIICFYLTINYCIIQAG